MKAYRFWISLNGERIADGDVDDLNDLAPILEYEAGRLEVGSHLFDVRILIREPDAEPDDSGVNRHGETEREMRWQATDF